MSNGTFEDGIKAASDYILKKSEDVKREALGGATATTMLMAQIFGEWSSDILKLKNEAPLVEAAEIRDGESFRKKNGSMIYRKISESSKRRYNLDDRFVWGVSDNGNVATVKKDVLVHRENALPEVEEYDECCEENRAHRQPQHPAYRAG